MTSAHDKKARIKGKAERGMELTLLATKLKIALVTLIFFISLGLAIKVPEFSGTAFWGVVNLFLLAAFYFGLLARLAWAALLFAAVCTIDIFGAVGKGIEITDFLNIADAILLFVVLSGIVIWFRSERGTAHT